MTEYAQHHRALGIHDRCNIKENVSGGVRDLALLSQKFHGNLRLRHATELFAYTILSDPRLSLEFVSFRDIQSMEGRVVGHAQEEATDRPYLFVEGTDAKLYLLYQNADIQTARHEGKLKVNSFITLEKQFANRQPFVRVDDLGDADDLLENSAHFESAARRAGGGTETGQVWGGWLGKYHAVLGQQLAMKRGRPRGAQERDLAR